MKVKVRYSISNLETSLYFILWICSIGYAIYAVSKTTNDYFSSQDFEDTYDDFDKGWSILNTLQDISDIEWRYVKIILVELLPWGLLQIIIGEILSRTNSQLLIYWYATISLCYISTTFGLNTLIYFSFQPLLGYLALQFKSKFIVWIYYIFSLIIINYIKWRNFEIYNEHNYVQYITTTGIFWINLRSLNYFLETVNDELLRKIRFKNIVTCFAYCLYLPVLFTGPLILFVDFKTVFVAERTQILQRLQQLLKKLLRYTFWALFIEFTLHFVYVNALTFQPKIFINLDSWALYGAGYCMGQFFQLKYIVFYGFSTTLANFEGIPVPQTPKCIGRIHLYSDMWKYFDRGLYLFLLRYIYIPFSGAKKTVSKKLIASSMCFIFVYVWHGIQSFIAIWSFLNFIGVTIETVVFEISQRSFIKKKTKSMSEGMYKRLKCLLASPLFAMSAISNFYFFAGKDIGDIYVYRFLNGPGFVTTNILIVLYFGSQVSTEIKLWEQSRGVKKVS